jgi:myosin heavy chain 9/10/11/14
MATIFNLFSRQGLVDAETTGFEPKSRLKRGGKPSPQEEVYQPQDVAAFERLGQRQQSIDGALTEVHRDLVGLQSLIGQATALKSELAEAFDEHRKLALAHFAVQQDRDNAELRFREKATLCDAAQAELVALRAEFDEVRRHRERVVTDFEALEHRHHLAAVAKRETEEALTRTSASLAAVQDEAEGLRLEVSSLQGAVDSYGARIGELTEKYNEANSRGVLLSNRCESLEVALHLKEEELISSTERLEALRQEKDALSQSNQQKDQEISDLRSDITHISKQAQQDKKAREYDINQLKGQLDFAQAEVKALQEVNREIGTENARHAALLRKLADDKSQSDINLNRLESRLSRLNAKLEVAGAAKTQLEESRAAISARLEAATQALSERESDIKRLEAEFSRLSIEAESQNATARDTIEALTSKVFELEKELSAQRNEAAYFTSQFGSLRDRKI